MARARRGHGEGSIYQRRDGYWVGSIEAGRCRGGHLRRDGTPCPGGERRRSRVVRRTKKAVLDELKEAKGQGLGDHRTIEAYGRYWLDEVKAGTIAESSLGAYRDRFENHIVPHLGHLRLRKITSTDGVAQIQTWMNTLAAAGLSPSTRNDVRVCLSMILRHAVGARAITWNPAEFVSSPRPESRTDDAFEAEEAEAALAAARGDRLEALYFLAVKYGMRQGELLALPLDRVDLDRKVLKVGKAKTKAGVRDLPLLAGATEVLRAHLKRRAEARLAAGPAWQENGLLFCEADGAPITPRHVRDYWNKVLKAAKVAHRCRNCDTEDRCSSSIRRFHASRHTAATLLLEAGVPLEVVSAILGHSGIKITADIYAKVRADLMRRGLLKLDEAAMR